ncbi:hypothetical protein DNL40_02440 [Xylanimonas oleitrophica]|uniref:Uncharacterized protein n=1 Tax=Xylanimonas oleitrophica TaxID=2607479 RepID=A0A2W5WUU7_9MICO|nr:hypothetical protein [Xylanimonas oleitrophica]PZR55249.1 hypothetical protein DNL40_02440 [Xylanimonas oleitrophica]
MSDTYTIPTAAERLGIHAHTGTRGKKPTPPRHPVFLVHAAVHALFTLYGAARVLALGDGWVTGALTVLNAIGAVVSLREWWQRKTPTSFDLIWGLVAAGMACWVLTAGRTA